MAIQSYCFVLDMIELSGTREPEFSFFWVPPCGYLT